MKEIDWKIVTESMHKNGYAIVPEVLSADQCKALLENYNQPHLYRKTVNMERYRFGFGEYKYFDYPLPPLIHQLRAELYRHLVPIANTWFKVLNINTVFPQIHSDFLEQCQNKGQCLA